MKKIKNQGSSASAWIPVFIVGFAFVLASVPAHAARVVRGESVWVARNCDTDTGAEELKKAGIRVAQSREGSSGKAAGACTIDGAVGSSFLIRRADLPKAKALGFKESLQELKVR